MKGKLYGIGVGPGDCELITVKALRIMKECDVIAIPGKKTEESVAYQIAKGAYPEIIEKEIFPFTTPMTKDKQILSNNYKEMAKKLEVLLDEHKSVGVLTLGDPTVYSTYMYLHQEIIADGYEAEIINGIPSFCAAAAAFGMSLVEREEQLHLIPSSYHIEDALKLSGTKVFMKAASKLGAVKEILTEQNCHAVMVEKCGMEGEKRYSSIEEIPEEGSYYSIIIAKTENEKKE